MSNQNLIIQILVKYALDQPLTSEEKALLAAWRAESISNDRFASRVGDPEWVANHRRELHQAPINEVWSRIQKQLGKEVEEVELPKPVPKPIPRQQTVVMEWLTGVAVILAVVAGTWAAVIAIREPRQPAAAMVTAAPPKSTLSSRPVSPGHPYHYRLTLQDGRVVFLDTCHVGAEVAKEGSYLLRKTDSNRLAYIPLAGGKPKSRFDAGQEYAPAVVQGKGEIHNRLAVTSGVFGIQFADGSTAWLRQATRLSYSPDVSGKLDLDGQAYFDIVHNEYRRVHITAGTDMDIRVLGTRLDVQTFSDGTKGKVALYTDSATVRWGSDSVVVRQYFQAVLGSGQAPMVEEMPAITSDPVWVKRPGRQRYFEFRNSSLPSVLRSLEEWYGITTFYRVPLKGVPITGRLPADLPLDMNLKAIEKIEHDHVRFRWEDSTLFVMPIGK